MNAYDPLVSFRRLLSNRLLVGLYGALGLALSGGVVVTTILARRVYFRFLEVGTPGLYGT